MTVHFLFFSYFQIEKKSGADKKRAKLPSMQVNAMFKHFFFSFFQIEKNQGLTKSMQN